MSLVALLCAGMGSAAAHTTVTGEVRDADQSWVCIENASVKVHYNDALIGEGVTDADGACTITLTQDVTSGKLVVEVTADGYEPGSQTINVSSWMPPAFDIELSKIQTGNPTITVKGWVMEKVTVDGEEDTRGIEDAAVSITHNGNAVGSYMTDWNGYYEIEVEEALAEPYVISVSKEGYLPVSEEITLDLTATSFSKDIIIEKDPNRKLSSSVSGTVQLYDNYQVKVGGAEIKLLEGEAVLGTATSADNGSFTISVDGRELNGTFTLTAYKSGYNPVSKDVNFTDGKAIDQVIMLQTEKCYIKGQVYDEATNEVIDHVEIWVREDGKDCQYVYSSSWSGYNFELTTVNPNAKYSLRASAEDYITKEVEIETPAMGSTLTVDIKLKKALVIDGTVREYNNGEGIVGAEVSLCKGDEVIDSMVSDEYGEFKMVFDQPDNMPADGEYTVRVSAEGYLPTSVAVTVADGSIAEPLSIRMRMNKVIISGIVYDESNNRLEGAKVQLKQNDAVVAEQTTTMTGEFSMELAEVNADPYMLETSYGELVPDKQEINGMQLGDWLEYAITLKKQNGVEAVAAGNAIVSAGKGFISVEADEPIAVSVCTMAGTVVYDAEITASGTLYLVPGMYVVRYGDAAVKVVVR